jgi:hypothetical protein
MSPCDVSGDAVECGIAIGVRLGIGPAVGLTLGEGDGERYGVGVATGFLTVSFVRLPFDGSRSR